MSARRLVIHAGMHKTGSSSIQRALAGLDGPRFRYLDLGRGPNHSGALHAAFSSTPERYHTFVRRQYDADVVRQAREDVRARIAAQLDGAGEATCLLSAEGVALLDPAGLADLHAFVRAHAREVRVIAYVRPPRSFMESAFQQRVKGGLAGFNLDGLHPRYRKRLRPIEAAFGRSSLRLLPYRRERLRDGDVVADFCAQLGLETPPNAVAELNQSLSRPAVALLYTYRRFGAPYGVGREEIRANTLLVEALGALQGPRLRFGGPALQAVLDEREPDLRWVERRLGEPLEEAPAGDEGVVASEDDLLVYDDAQLEWIAGWGVRVPPRRRATPPRVARAIHAALRAIANPSRLGR